MLSRALLLAVAFALALPGAALARDDVVRSFDGTRLTVSFFPASGLKEKHKAPTILIGPGWAQQRDKADSQGSPLFGYLGPKPFLDAGYNVLTWDPRGFNSSGGIVQVDGPKTEGRDVKRLISYVAAQPEAKLDGRDDPRVGMEGASYGGGIQLVTAGIDHRVDALIPVIAWNSLVTSLLKDEAVKAGWSNVLVSAGLAASHDRLDPHITDAYQEGLVNGTVSRENRHWFKSRGPGDELVGRIRVPTLLVQGTADTLFTLQEAIRNYDILHAHGVPVKMMWFCGGHGTCLTDPGDTSVVHDAMLDWFARYLRGHKKVDTGPGFQWVDQDGAWRSSRRWPLRRAGALRARGAGVLALTPGYSESGDPIAATPAADSVHLAIPAPQRRSFAVGAPKLKLTYSGTAAPKTATHVYAQIVDLGRGVVMGPVVTPIPVTLDGRRHTVTRPLEPVAWTVVPGGRYELQVVPSTQVYGPQLSSGAISLSRVEVSLPLVGRR